MAENPEDLIVTDAELRRQLPALAKELKIGGVDGSVPIFATLAEAQAWEAKNPGKKALTLEPSTPDTTPPTAGVLSVTPAHTSAALSVSGASDNRAVTGYAFQVGATGGWSGWQSSPSFTATGLTVSTSYAFRHKVRDAAGNEALGAAVTVSTTAKPPLQPGDIITSDAYTSYADGTDISGKYTDVSMGGSAWQYGGASPAPTVSGGALVWPSARSVFGFTGPDQAREDKEVAFTVKTLPATGGSFKVVLRNSGGKLTEFVVKPDGGISTLLQGPAGDIFGPAAAAGTVKAGSRVTFGVVGNTGYYTVDGVKTTITSLQGNTGGTVRLDGAGSVAIDDLVVKAL